ncbi:A/G-specific adenine glycosylase [Hydrogenimonas sp.]
MNYSDIHIAIARWYAQNGRHNLPWRRTRDPYRIYVSEMMLQQTQVKTVLERFYFPFLERFPTLQSVADATLEEVLHAWQGLGYYRRARYIHETARIAASNLPTDPDELVKLPGIGKSTAHAIAAFSTHAPVPILDANVRRILHRFFARKKATEKELWRLAEELLDRENPYDYNQAMMDLGATVCLPKAPRCDACPLCPKCRGKEAPLLYPEKRGKKARPVRRTRYLLLEKGSKILMRKRISGMLGGLWELPTVENIPEDGEKLFEIVHDYSHFRRVAEVWRYEGCEEIKGEWVDADTLHEVPVSSLERKIFARLFEE